MTGPELLAWLGYGPDDPVHKRRIRPEILERMASVPVPPAGPTDEHLAVFRALLECVGGPPDRLALFLPDPERDESCGQTWGDKGCVRDLSKCTHPPGDGCEWCCMTCNTDRHFCRGCGTVVSHLEAVCIDCKRSYVRT